MSSQRKRKFQDVKSQRLFLDSLGEKLGIIEGDRAGWYKVTYQAVVDHGGSTLIGNFDNSLIKMLQNVYKDFEWDPLRFSQVPRNYWVSMENQRRFMDDLGLKLGIPPGDYAAWYKVSYKTIIENGGNTIFKKHQSSISAVFEAIYPEYKWDKLRFAQVPRNYWASPPHQRAYLDLLGVKLGIEETNASTFERWYQLTSKMTIENGGAGLLAHYNGSVSKMLSAVFPSFPWDSKRFPKAPQNFWDSLENQKMFIFELEKRLGIKEGDREAWYGVSDEAVASEGGDTVLAKYHDSLPSLLSNVYPDFAWKKWKFVGRSKLDPESTKALLAHLENALDIKSAADWARVSRGSIINLVFGDKKPSSSSKKSQLLKTLAEALKAKYPSTCWDNLATVNLKSKDRASLKT